MAERSIPELEQVKGNTWVIKSWVMIPLYRLDAGRCILLDSGLAGQRQELEALLRRYGLRCVGIIGSHAHMDHAGNHAYFQKQHGATIVLPLGEAGIQASDLGLELGAYNLSPGQLGRHDSLSGTACVADQIILPGDQTVTLHAVSFEVIHTPGHSVDHIALRTPDDVVYLGDAVMTGRTLFRSKFPYALSMADYFESLRKLRTLEAEYYIAAHFGVYPEILSFVDMELSFLQKRMLELLDLAEGDFSLEDLTDKICKAFDLWPKTVGDMAYFERATRAYLHHLLDLDHLEAVLTQGRIRYRRREHPKEGQERTALPKTGLFALREEAWHQTKEAAE